MSTTAQPIPGTFTALPVAGTFKPLAAQPSPYAKPGPYTTQLAPKQEAGFQSWVQQNNIPWRDSPTADYDMRGFYKAMQAGKAQRAPNQHFPDTFKTPYHKSFSNESIYATPDAPHWAGSKLIDKSGKVVFDEALAAQPSANGSTSPVAQPSAPQVGQFAHMEDNPQGEGTYTFQSPDGSVLDIPYSKVLELLNHPEGAVGSGDAELDRYKSEVLGARDRGWTISQDDIPRLYADYTHDPRLKDVRRQNFVNSIPAAQVAIGMAREGARTVVGAHDIVAGKPGPNLTSTITGKPPEASAVRKFADAPQENYFQHLGGFGEGMGEFMTGEELLGALAKIAKAPVTLAEAAKVEAEIKKGSTLGKVFLEALKQGGLAGGQTYVKTGGDAGAAATTGAAAAGTAGILGGVSAAAGKAAASRATTVESVGGVPMEIPAEVRNQRGTPQQRAGQESIRRAAQDTASRHLEEVNESRAVPASPPGLPSGTGPFEFNLRGVTPREVDSAVDESDVVRSQSGAPKVAMNRHAAQIPATHTNVPEGGTPSGQNTREIGSLASTVPDRMLKRDPGFTHGIRPGENPMQTNIHGGGTLTTQDANIAKAHIANLNDVIDSEAFQGMKPEQQTEILDARADAQRQMAQYHERVMQNLPGAGKPNLQPINIPAAVQKIGSFTDAADVLEKTATQGYDLLNDVTAGRFNAVRQAMKDAWATYKGASGEEAQAAAEKGVEATEGRMTQLLDGLRGIVDDKNLDGFNDAFRNAQALRRVATAVDSTFVGNPAASARSWEYRGFDGNKLMANLSRLQQTMGTGPLTRLIGEENLNTLYRVAELNRSQAQRAKFGLAISEVAKHLPVRHVTAAGVGAAAGWKATHTWEGAAAGAAIGGATANASVRVMNSMLTNPKVAKQLIYAMDYGARPENYGPYIATMIQKAETERVKRQQQEQQDEGTK